MLDVVQENISLADHCSWRVGGRARYLYIPSSRESLLAFLSRLSPTEPVTLLGLGSNTLVRSGGLEGVTIIMQSGLRGIRIQGDRIHVEAGAACASVARQAVRAGILGLEFLAGIPGTMGGALAMNAGCHGSETWSWVESVEMFDRHGVVTSYAPESFRVRYREVERPQNGGGFLSAVLKGVVGDPEVGKSRLKTLLDYRVRTQPTDKPSCGSVFRNPPSDYAARLIEACGLKGLRVGQAQVSPKHANFIVCLEPERGSADEVEDLIAQVHDAVLQNHGVDLKVEAHLLGSR